MLKLKVAGDKLSVFRELAAAERLSRVSGSSPSITSGGKPQELGSVLQLLDDHGFRYATHDWESEAPGGGGWRASGGPAFVYACREGAGGMPC